MTTLEQLTEESDALLERYHRHNDLCVWEIRPGIHLGINAGERHDDGTRGLPMLCLQAGNAVEPLALFHDLETGEVATNAINDLLNMTVRMMRQSAIRAIKSWASPARTKRAPNGETIRAIELTEGDWKAVIRGLGRLADTQSPADARHTESLADDICLRMEMER